MRAVLEDLQQNAWQLMSIQLSGWMSLPLLAISVWLVKETNFYSAALTIFVGNALLWFIRLMIVLMSHPKRQSTLDLAKAYLGKRGGYFIGALCILSSLVWFILQTTAASQTLVSLFAIQESEKIDQFVQMSVFLGVVTTFLCMNGIVVLRKLTQFAFPLLLIAFLIVFFLLPLDLPTKGPISLSLSGLAIIIGANLGITADLPTFFRHSKSLTSSIVALTGIQIISLALSIVALFFGTVISNAFTLHHFTPLGEHAELLKIGLIALVFLSVISANVANVYSASVGWEILAPAALVGKKEYLLIGLSLTTLFILVSGLISIDFLLGMTDAALINLTLVFLIGYTLALLGKKAPDRFEQRAYFLAWSFASIMNALQYCNGIVSPLSPLLTSCAIIFFVVSFFLGIRKVKV